MAVMTGVDSHLIVSFRSACVIPADAEISFSVANSLSRSPSMRVPWIRVAVDQGVVTLPAPADSYWQKHRAEE
jgi:osmotically-inducible protein OsmY